MIYSVENIKSTSKSDTSILENISFMNIGLELLEENDNALRMTLLSLHDDVLNESKIASSSTKKIFMVIKKIIKFFLKSIQDLFGRFYGMILEFIGSDKTIKKYKDKLHNMPVEFTINKYNDIEYYNYTNLDTNVPDPDLQLLFSENMKESLKELKDATKGVSKQETLSAINKLTSETDTMSNGAFFSELRARIINTGKILGDRTMISAELYNERLFSLFRDGADRSYRGKLVMSPNQVAKSCDRFLEFSKLLNIVKKQKETIEKTAKYVEDQLIDQISHNVLDTKDPEIIYALDLYEKKKVAQLAEMCNICSLAFAAKITALKDCAIMDKKICYRAISHILSKDLEE